MLMSLFRQRLQDTKQEILQRLERNMHHLAETQKILASLNPENVLRRGYAIVTSSSPGRPIAPGVEIVITTSTQNLTAEVKNVQERH